MKLIFHAKTIKTRPKYQDIEYLHKRFAWYPIVATRINVWQNKTEKMILWLDWYFIYEGEKFAFRNKVKTK